MTEVNKPLDIPTIFIIFGITGDLAQKKLIPALLDLFVRGSLPPRFKIIGFSRRDLSRGEFKAFLEGVVEDKMHNHSSDTVEAFLREFEYHRGLFDEHQYFESLKERLRNIDDSFGQCSNKLFYLAIPPSQYEGILKHLEHTKMSEPCSNKTGWTRILVEKPFGKDLKTAKMLDNLLGKLFKEEQIFRIDHYLAKEALQNILTFRFANGLFEPVWNKKYISQVKILFYERDDASKRGAFYDSVGALRDVGQNHMLQMLALVAMEEPKEMTEKYVRAERAKVLGKLKSLSKNTIATDTVRGQYDGFAKENGVNPDSKVETFFRIKTEIKNTRWKGVPFIMEFGKALAEEKMEIVVHMNDGKKNTKTKADYGCEVNKCKCNILTFRIQPDEGISLTLWVKKPGFRNEVEEKKLNFTYKDSGLKEGVPDAYERVLFDCISGEQTLFTSTKEVLNAWKFITPIINGWENTKLHIYQKGSFGPKI